MSIFTYFAVQNTIHIKWFFFYLLMVHWIVGLCMKRRLCVINTWVNKEVGGRNLSDDVKSVYKSVCFQRKSLWSDSHTSTPYSWTSSSPPFLNFLPGNYDPSQYRRIKNYLFYLTWFVCEDLVDDPQSVTRSQTPLSCLFSIYRDRRVPNVRLRKTFSRGLLRLYG